jgi:cell division protein FtsB
MFTKDLRKILLVNIPEWIVIMFYKMRQFVPTVLLTLIMTYCGVQYLTGDKGFFSQESRKIELAKKTLKLESLLSERVELEARARFLRVDNLSEDLLEERARVLLGLSEPGVYVIRDIVVPEKQSTLSS